MIVDSRRCVSFTFITLQIFALHSLKIGTFTKKPKNWMMICCRSPSEYSTNLAAIHFDSRSDFFPEFCPVFCYFSSKGFTSNVLNSPTYCEMSSALENSFSTSVFRSEFILWLLPFSFSVLFDIPWNLISFWRLLFQLRPKFPNKFFVR